MKTKEFDYDLPQERIAQHPVEPRDSSRLLVLDRRQETIEHRIFHEIGEHLQPGDILVANDSRVYPARLYGYKTDTGGKVELLLLEREDHQRWRTLVGGSGLREGVQVSLYEKNGAVSDISGTVAAVLHGAEREIVFSEPLLPLLEQLGHTPLPPYIHETLDDSERYQTVFSRPLGSAAAPTAGLHFTGDLLLSLREEGVLFETCTLHVGLDTFKPVESAKVAEHTIHSEWATLSVEAARRINEAKLAGGRIVAVGTTSSRVLETAALRSAGIEGPLHDISARDTRGETSEICPWKPVAAFSERTDLYIYPGYRFRAVDAIITNFHLPQSSLLMMVSAFAGRELIMDAYKTAVDEAYRFYSFGDAMLIL
ncbi:MAG TPA: tRNA preQ1(34) S-adenosylmethionine ribosyltransferase-isomerase QueA [Candidatus Sulfomarinibacteraceae bacterium]|nr:tRNA preQ1(34) S-adenosylmethionine ribosyltransferase-isomerase QueA [Candidatus Sulfomarinibacteraceae bacterium]